jgi:hypothetical protein
VLTCQPPCPGHSGRLASRHWRGRLHLGMLAGFIPEQWPASNRNPWPTSVGIISQSDRQNPASPFQRRPCGCGLDRACPFNPRSTIGMKDADLLFPSKSMKCGKSHLALPVFRGGGGLIIRLGRQPGRQAGLCRAASVVNELKEAQVDGQLLLRETAVRTEPGAQQRPEALDGINVGFAETVAILVTRILAPPMADRPGRSPRSSGGHRWRTRRCG